MPCIQYVNLGQVITTKNSSNLKEGKIMNNSKIQSTSYYVHMQNFRHNNL